MKMKVHAKFYRLVQEPLVLIVYANSDSLKRWDVAEGSFQIL